MTNGIGRPNTLEGLPRNPKRDAFNTMAGYEYQIWSSIKEWILLGPDECILLEGTADIDQVGPADATRVRPAKSRLTTTTRVKPTFGRRENEVGGRKYSTAT